MAAAAAAAGCVRAALARHGLRACSRGRNPRAGAHEDVRGGRLYGSGRAPRLEAGRTVVRSRVGAGRCVQTESRSVCHVSHDRG